ncbi:MAG TPA: DUF192 domain-containing protein, partial [Flavobacterium sp.]|nr:DUF192 domain-containing protein [Flavobacterium sp.]
KPDIQDKKFVEIAGTRINVKLAATPEERERGLSGSEKLQEDEGLLFVFDEPGEYVFWMKDMNFAIDIIWILESETGDKRIAYIKKDAKPDSYPETFGDGVIAKYVLEVNSGFSEKNNLKKGDKIEFSL